MPWIGFNDPSMNRYNKPDSLLLAEMRSCAPQKLMAQPPPPHNSYHSPGFSITQ